MRASILPYVLQGVEISVLRIKMLKNLQLFLLILKLVLNKHNQMSFNQWNVNKQLHFELRKNISLLQQGQSGYIVSV